MEKNLRTGNLDSIYLLYGEEQYLLEQTVKKIKKNFGELVNGINYIQMDEKNVETLISDIETPAFGYPKKLIIVKNSGLFKKEARGKKKDEKQTKKTTKGTSLQEKIANYIEENISNIKESVVIVFIEQEIGTNELSKKIQNLGTTCNFEKLKPIQDKYKEILNNKEYLEKVYTQGAENARKLASKTLEDVKSRIGIL